MISLGSSAQVQAKELSQVIFRFSLFYKFIPDACFSNKHLWEFSFWFM